MHLAVVSLFKAIKGVTYHKDVSCCVFRKKENREKVRAWKVGLASPKSFPAQMRVALDEPTISTSFGQLRMLPEIDN